MNQIELAYGSKGIEFSFDTHQCSILEPLHELGISLSDEDLGRALDNPLNSAPLDELVSADDSVLIVVSDATRATGSAQVVNLLIRRLIQYGVARSQIAIIFATGIHRPVTSQEKLDLLSPFVAQRIKTLDHDAYDKQALRHFGTTESGLSVELNRALKEFSVIIVIGGVGFHYFAGFTGGRKSICPGLASAPTIEATHMLALDRQKGGRRRGVATGLLEGNAVHEECERVAAMVNPAFAINTIVNEKGGIVNVFCGDWRASHRQACETYLQNHSVEIEDRRKVVIASCGGWPYDINLIQAHKSLDMAAFACDEGGSIILLAECRDGFGRSDFLKWFVEENSAALERRLYDAYEVNGQTAWALMTKAERFRVFLVSNLAAEDVLKMRMIPARSLSEALNTIDKATLGYIMPRASAVLPRNRNESLER